MNEEQKAWLEKVKAIIVAAEIGGGVSNYEFAIEALQSAIDTCPEP